jgi:hypothetical protein
MAVLNWTLQEPGSLSRADKPINQLPANAFGGKLAPYKVGVRYPG